MAEHQTHADVDDAADETSTTIAAMNQMVARLFDHWRIDANDQAALLGQPFGSSCSLSGHEFVASNETVERMGHLLAIHSSLRSL